MKVTEIRRSKLHYFYSPIDKKHNRKIKVNKIISNKSHFANKKSKYSFKLSQKTFVFQFKVFSIEAASNLILINIIRFSSISVQFKVYQFYE